MRFVPPWRKKSAIVSVTGDDSGTNLIVLGVGETSTYALQYMYKLVLLPFPM